MNVACVYDVTAYVNFLAKLYARIFTLSASRSLREAVAMLLLDQSLEPARELHAETPHVILFVNFDKGSLVAVICNINKAERTGLKAKAYGQAGDTAPLEQFKGPAQVHRRIGESFVHLKKVKWGVRLRHSPPPTPHAGHEKGNGGNQTSGNNPHQSDSDW